MFTIESLSCDSNITIDKKIYQKYKNKYKLGNFQRVFNMNFKKT